MAKESSVMKPTGIGSKGAIRGSMKSGAGPQYSHLPGPNSHPNANVKERSVTKNMPKPGRGTHFDHMPSDPRMTED